jgi:hypothetical protein
MRKYSSRFVWLGNGGAMFSVKQLGNDGWAEARHAIAPCFAEPSELAQGVSNFTTSSKPQNATEAPIIAVSDVRLTEHHADLKV